MNPSPLKQSSATDCLAGGGEMGALMRSMDWSNTSIGAVEFWSPALRMMVLRNLGARVSDAKSGKEACAIAAATLGQHREDVPFSLFYLISEDRKYARLAGCAGAEAGQSESRVEIDLGEETSREEPWPLAETIRSRAMQIVRDLRGRLSSAPPGPWSDSPISAVVCPIRSNIAHQVAGLLVLGISSRLKFDERYRDFCELVTSPVATAIANACLVVDCPPMGESVYVDRGMWEKIVLNLLSNAFKFTFEGEVAVSFQMVGKCAELCVRDTGSGIAKHELPHLFERFHRIESARGRTFEGSGIGLALVHELAKLHGGTVRAESVYGKGSRFIVTIPLGSAHLPAAHVGTGVKQSSPTVGAGAFLQEATGRLPDAPGVGELSPAAHESTRRSSVRILLADDHADLRRYVQRLLSQIYEVRVVTDGEAALAAARENPPDLVLTDVLMPRLDGFGLLAALRADVRTQHIPVILLSARAGEESRLEGLSAGANDYLVKPFSARDLLARVSASLKHARDSREALEREHDLRTSAEKAATLSRDELLAELTAMKRLHQLSTRFLREIELQPRVDDMQVSEPVVAELFGDVAESRFRLVVAAHVIS